MAEEAVILTAGESQRIAMEAEAAKTVAMQQA